MARIVRGAALMIAMLPSSTSAAVIGRSGIGRGTHGWSGAPDAGSTSVDRRAGCGASAVGRASGATQGPSDCAGGATERGYAVTRARSGLMEGYGPSSYGDGMADVYDEWYATRGDIDGAVAALAALASAAGPGPVLELGIGSGRLALPLAASGVEVWGIDASAAMVARLRAKPGGDRVPVAVGDMADLDLSSVPGRRRGAVLVGVRRGQHVLQPDHRGRAGAVSRARPRACCAPSGRLVIEAFVPAPDAPASSVDARTVAVDHVVLTVTSHDRRLADRRRPAHRAARVGRAAASVVDPLRRAGRARPHWRRLRGCRLVERWSDWRRTPFTADDNVHVSVYEMAR